MNGMKRLQNWIGGRTHLIIWVCLFLGSGAYALSVRFHDSTGLNYYLMFLVAMSGVQAGRSAVETFKPNQGGSPNA